MELISLVYNREKDALALLQSVAEQSVQPTKVWLIDNGSDRPLAIDCSQYSFAIEVIRIEKNRGIAGYNLGFEKSKAKFVIAVDSDVTIDRFVVERFQEATRKFPALVLGGARILDATSRLPMPDNPIHGKKEFSDGGRQMVQFNGCCFLANREEFLRLGGFDRRLFIYVNEWDLTLRAFGCVAMNQIRYYPEIVAYHKTAPSKDRAQLYHALVRRNEFWVRWKYYPLALALDYSARFLIGSLRRMFLGNPGDFKLFGKYLYSATQGLRWAISERAPVPARVFKQLLAMRAECKAPENLVENY